MAYRADIEIAVRGAQDLKRLQNEISATSKLITSLNSYIENIGSGGVVRNISNLQDTVQKAANAFNAAALNTEEATIAAKKYIDATADLNAGLRERQALLKSINEEERKTRLAAIGREVGGRAAGSYGGPIGPGEASPIGALVGQKSPVAERVQRTIQARKDELQLQQALLRLEEKSAGELNKKVQSQEALVQGTREVLNLVQQQADKARFLAGQSGTAMQGPLAGSGAMGFPVALPMTKAEQAGLEINAKKQEILNRMVSTRQQLSGLAENLQRLDQNSVVAIADAARAQQRVNAAKEETIRLSERELAIAKQGALLAGKFSPIGGAENIPGSPAAKRAQAARRREALSNAVIGGAFPLLFGQGPGAALGGGLGGAAGGLAGGQFGFGLSLVGTALGAAIDTFTQAAVESGKSLNDPIKNFQKLADAGLIASRSQQQYIERLIEAGRVTEAAAAIQDEIIKKIGVSGLKDLQAAGAASDKLNKAFAEFSLQAQAAVAGPLAEILTWLTGVVVIGNTVNRQAAQQTDILQGLSATDQKSLQQQEQQILQGANLFNEAQKRQEVQKLYQQFASRANIQRPGVSTDLTPERKAAAQTQELQAQVTLEGKKLSLVGMTLEKNGRAYVEAAKAVALQEYENKLLEIKNSWIGQAYNAERNTAMIRLANLEYAGKLKAIDAERVKKGREQRDIDQSLLGLQIELIQTTLSAADADVARTAAVTGEIASLKESVQQQEARLLLESRILDLQLQQKLLAKDITQQEKNLLEKIYYNQKANLQTQVDTKTRLLQLDIARLETARQLAALEGPRRIDDIRQQQGSRLAGIQAQLANPFGGNSLEQVQQYMDQQMRYYETITPLERTLTDLQLERANISATASKEELATKDRAIADKKAELDLQRQYLTELNAAEITLLRQQQAYQKYGFIANEVSKAFSDSISGIITGTTTVAEAFGRMFESIGKAFIDMATQILAQQLFLTVFRALNPAPQSALVPGMNVPLSQMPAGMAFAEGGFVTGPTRALIGEGGEAEYVIPASKMRGAMSRYASGARGSAVIPAGGDTEGGGTATMAPASIDVRYTVERINSVDYVTADQFQAGLQQAAAQGAERGQQLALRRLQQSPSTRRRVGI